MGATRAIKPLTAPQYPSEGREAPHLLYEINQATAAIGSDQRSIPLYASETFFMLTCNVKDELTFVFYLSGLVTISAIVFFYRFTIRK